MHGGIYEEMNTSDCSENVEEPQINDVSTDDIQHSSDGVSTSCFTSFLNRICTGRSKSEKENYKYEKRKIKLQKFQFESEKFKHESEKCKYESEIMKYKAEKIKRELDYEYYPNVESSTNSRIKGPADNKNQSVDVYRTNSVSQVTHVAGKKPEETQLSSGAIQENSNMYNLSRNNQSCASNIPGLTDQTSDVSGNAKEHTNNYIYFKVIAGIRFIQKDLAVRKNRSAYNYSRVCLVGTEENINSLESSDADTPMLYMFHIVKITRGPSEDNITVLTPESKLTEQQLISLLQVGFTENDLASLSHSANKYSLPFNELLSIIGSSITDTQVTERKFDSPIGVSKQSQRVVSSSGNEQCPERSNYENHSKHSDELITNSLQEIPNKMHAKQSVKKEDHPISDIDKTNEIKGLDENPSKRAQVRTEFPVSLNKVRNIKVKHKSNKQFRKQFLLTPQDEDTLGSLITKVFPEDTVRQLVHEFFSDDMKTHWARPSVPWPSMHPLLPYKLRYLDNTGGQNVDKSPQNKMDEDDCSDSSDR